MERKSYFMFNPNKEKTVDYNTEHDKQIDEMRDILDNIDFTTMLFKGEDKIYFYLDDYLPKANDIAKTLREVANSEFVEINYDSIKHDISRYNFNEVMDTLKKDCDEYKQIKANIEKTQNKNDEMVA